MTIKMSYVQYSRYAKIPPGLMRLMVENQIGRNGWPVMAVLCMSVMSDRTFHTKPAITISQLTGLTLNQVSRGLKELRDKNIIIPVARINKNGELCLDRSSFGHAARYCFTNYAWSYIENDIKDSK